MKIRNAPDLETVRSDLLPDLEARYGEIHCKTSDKILEFKFKTEESALLGQITIGSYLDKHRIAGRTKDQGSNRRLVALVIGEGNE